MNYKAFKLKNSYFENMSSLHGINHTYRVMVHVLNIGMAAGINHEIVPAFCGAFIHDMARQHDGYCTEHGYWAARFKLPLFIDFFKQQGLNDEDFEAIRIAVTNHSVKDEVAAGHPHYKTVALLKDADALDRIRISENNLKTEYLRFPESIAMVEFARKLFYKTQTLKLKNFEMILRISNDIKKETGKLEAESAH
ncbi:MAG: HD domain-containing protein [Bacteroidales bacterium]|nr:HD domain-containing protein [Bacteroidales bacterium]